MPGAALSLVLAGAVAAVNATGAPATVPPLVDGLQLGAGWHVAGLPKQSKPMTRFTPETVQGRAALRVEADHSYGNLVATWHGVLAPHTLHWAWRVQRPAHAGDMHTKAGDDAAIKVCLSFDLPLEQVPFLDRQFLRLARNMAGEALPAATLCWVWGTTETVGELIDSPFTRRVRYIILRNNADAAGPWVQEQRDVAADFARAFGDESAQMPPLIAAIVSGDADNTGGHSVAHVEGLRFEP